MKDKSPPTAEELQAVKKIRLGNKIVLGLFLGFMPASLIVNFLFPGRILLFAIPYVVIAGCISYPASFAKCPRCGKNFNMYHPFDSEASVNDGGGSGGGNCIYCKFPFTRRKGSRGHQLTKDLYRSIFR